MRADKIPEDLSKYTRQDSTLTNEGSSVDSEGHVTNETAAFYGHFATKVHHNLEILDVPMQAISNILRVLEM